MAEGTRVPRRALSCRGRSWRRRRLVWELDSGRVVLGLRSVPRLPGMFWFTQYNAGRGVACFECGEGRGLLF